MSGALQAIFQNQRSFSSLPAIGAAYEGGFFAGRISTAGNGTADFALVVGPYSSAQSVKQWKTTKTATTGTQSRIDGPTNTNNMNNASHPAAQFCKGLSIGGYTDWYMPAANELEVCYFNLKPATAGNNTNSGINPNAVPARASNYTTGNPAQTSATNFRTGAAEDFDDTIYWSSSENPNFSQKYSYSQNMFNGAQQEYDKDQSQRVRAIRRIAI
jgi:hypothetical protein